MIIGLVPISASAEDEHIDAETVETVEEVPSEDKATEEANPEDTKTPEESETIETPESSDKEAGETKESEVSEASGENGKSEDSADIQNADEDPEVSLAAAAATAEINGAVKSYYDIVEAFDAAQSSTMPSTIILEDFADLGTGNIVISKDCEIYLDLNGYILSGSYGEEEDGMIVLGGDGNPNITLTITSSYGGSDGKITNKSGNGNTSVIRVASTNAKLNIYDGTLERIGYNAEAYSAAVIDVAFGSAEISGGTRDDDGNVTAEGDFTITDSSEIKNGILSSVTLNGGALTVTGGKYNSL